VVENQRGGRLGDGDERAALGRGRTRRTARGVRKKFWPAGGGSVLTRSGGEEGPEGWTPHGGGAGERGGPWHGMEQRSGVASARAARGRATVENGGVDATWVNVADRWSGMLRGPDHQWLGAARH
jgi:hypothetical protein